MIGLYYLFCLVIVICDEWDAIKNAVDNIEE